MQLCCARERKRGRNRLYNLHCDDVTTYALLLEKVDYWYLTIKKIFVRKV